MLCKPFSINLNAQNVNGMTHVDGMYGYQILQTILAFGCHILIPFDRWDPICIVMRQLYRFRFLQAGSYPVSVPDGGRFPPDMKVLQYPHNLTFHPENGEHSLLVTSPEPGNWFLLAYINKKQNTDYVQEVRSWRNANEQIILPESCTTTE